MNGISPTYTWSIPGVVPKTNECLRQTVTDDARLLVDLYRSYRRGFLPNAGGLLDQPVVYHRAMSLIDRWWKDGGPSS